MKSLAKRKAICIVMDGIGHRESLFGNAVQLAKTPNLDLLKKNHPWTLLSASGTSVGLPSNKDMGNSEVGHNALGAGRIYDQGAKLVENAINDGSMFEGDCWQKLTKQARESNSTLHFIGLLSDGNVHSHERHLHQMLKRAKTEKIKRVRIHIILDGRDVGGTTAEIYVKRLQELLHLMHSSTFDAKIASGGGRMHITMDRYEADWDMVRRGWQTHVLGEAEHQFEDALTAIEFFRKNHPDKNDQYLPSFCIIQDNKAVGTIEDQDAVILFNFRGDRAIEISQAFSDDDFSHFDRKRFPKTFFAGMMQYDGDLLIPENYLVSPPAFENTLSQYLIKSGVQQFACSETQKYGHITYFWNGNNSGYIDQAYEKYLQIDSLNVPFDQKPEMKAYEITDALIQSLSSGEFDFGRINLANGDMVGHTGNIKAAIKAVEVVDDCVGKIFEACVKNNTSLMITADHGNADEMYDAKEADHPDWESLDKKIKPKTSHTLQPVPLIIANSKIDNLQFHTDVDQPNLGHVANTINTLLGIENSDEFLPSLIK